MHDRPWLSACGVVVLAWLVLPLAPVDTAVDPTVTFDPPSGVIGQEVTLSGSGWEPFEDVNVYGPGVSAETGEPWRQAEADGSGEFRVTATIPTLPAGRQSFFACQVCVGSGDPITGYSATFDVLRDLRFDPTEAPPGTDVGVTGSGWAQKDGDVLLFASRDESLDVDKALVVIRPQSDGTLGPDATFGVPSLPADRYTFFACQQCSNGEKAPYLEVSFEILEEAEPPSEPPQLTLEPTTASVGQGVTVSGLGWSDAAGPASVFASEVAMREGEDALGTARVTGGAFTLTIKVPPTDADSLSVFACQECGDSDLEAVQPLDIEAGVRPRARLQVVPSTGAPGADVRATGTGWRDGEVTLIAQRGTGGDQVVLEPATAEDGAFEQTVTVPTMRPGRIEIVACQQCREPDAPRAVFPFTVLAPPPARRTLEVAPRSAESGDTVTVSGAGWRAEDGEVTVYLEPGDDERTVWFHERPGRDGTFRKEVKAPDDDPGSYQVVACQHCEDASGFPTATATLELEEGSDRGSGIGLGALLVVGVVVWLLMRGGRTGAGDEPGPADPSSSSAQVTKVTVTAVPDRTFEVEVHPSPARRAGVGPPSLEVIGRPDPGRLSDQVEVSP